jgi:hypothetical protein
MSLPLPVLGRKAERESVQLDPEQSSTMDDESPRRVGGFEIRLENRQSNRVVVARIS